MFSFLFAHASFPCPVPQFPLFNMASTAEIRHHASAQAYEEATMEQGVEHKRPIVFAEVAQEDNETRPAGSTRWKEAILGICIALLPLYFVGFAIAAFVRNGTLARYADCSSRTQRSSLFY